MFSLRRLLRCPRMRKKRMLFLFMAGAVIFFTYQLGFISQLSIESKVGKKVRPIREEGPLTKGNDHKISYFKGNEVHPHNHHGSTEKAVSESRTSGAVYVCKQSKRIIASDKVNDDYCDCVEDGSDEFWTDACDNALFVCKKTKPEFPSTVVSSWVNDGICDCCDGSDEWLEKAVILSLGSDIQKRIHRYVSPCPNLC